MTHKRAINTISNACKSCRTRRKQNAVSHIFVHRTSCPRCVHVKVKSYQHQSNQFSMSHNKNFALFHRRLRNKNQTCKHSVDKSHLYHLPDLPNSPHLLDLLNVPDLPALLGILAFCDLKWLPRQTQLTLLALLSDYISLLSGKQKRKQCQQRKTKHLKQRIATISSYGRSLASLVYHKNKIRVSKYPEMGG